MPAPDRQKAGNNFHSEEILRERESKHFLYIKLFHSPLAAIFYSIQNHNNNIRMLFYGFRWKGNKFMIKLFPASSTPKGPQDGLFLQSTVFFRDLVRDPVTNVAAVFVSAGYLWVAVAVGFAVMTPNFAYQLHWIIDYPASFFRSLRSKRVISWSCPFSDVRARQFYFLKSLLILSLFFLVHREVAALTSGDFSSFPSSETPLHH